MTDHVECPYCSSKERDLWDYAWNGDEDEEKVANCGECGKDFILRREVSVDYSAHPLPGVLVAGDKNNG